VRRVQALALGVTLLGAAGRPQAQPLPQPAPVEPVRAQVLLATLGTFPRDLTDAVEAGLRAELQVAVRRIEEAPLPTEAYYRPSKRYRADKLLGYLHALEPAGALDDRTRILGMTEVDISTTKGRAFDWGIFGLGELGGRTAVISTFRLRRARDAQHFRFRVVTTAIHEVGHALGLEHCAEPACVMRDAEGTIRTVDASSGHLGPACRARLDARSPRVLVPTQ
jgi:archaemetzincin